MQHLVLDGKTSTSKLFLYLVFYIHTYQLTFFDLIRAILSYRCLLTLFTFSNSFSFICNFEFKSSKTFSDLICNHSMTSMDIMTKKLTLSALRVSSNCTLFLCNSSNSLNYRKAYTSFTAG